MDNYKAHTLIATNRYFYLYQGKDSIAQLLFTEDIHQAESLFKKLKSNKITALKIFDFTSEQTIKIEKFPRSIPYWQLAQWYFQKRKLFLNMFSKSLVRPMDFFKELLFLGIPTTSRLNELLILLDQNASFRYQLMSGFLEQGHTFFSLIHLLKPIYQKKILLIFIDQEFQMSQWLFCDKKPFFWRFWKPSLKEMVTQQLVPEISGLLRYLEKMIHTKDLEIVFFTEKYIDTSLFSIPQSTWFQPEEIKGLLEREGIPYAQQIRLFHQSLLFAPKPCYKIVAFNGTHTNFSQHLPRLFQASSATFLLCASYLLYCCFDLKDRNKEIEEKLSNLENHRIYLQKEIEKIPFSVSHATLIRKILEKLTAQQENFWSFLESISRVLGENYVLSFLSLGEEKAKIGINTFGINTFNSSSTPVFETFFESWQKLMDGEIYYVIHNPEEGKIVEVLNGEENAKKSDPLIIETTSPFREEK